MKKFIPNIFLAVLLLSCYVTRVVEPPREVHMGSIRHFKDTFSRALYRYVFSCIPCDSVRLRDKRGNILPQWTENTDTTKAYYYCSEIEKRNRMAILGLQYKNETIEMVLSTDGSINLSTANCSKYLYRVIEKWGDSIPVVLWT